MKNEKVKTKAFALAIFAVLLVAFSGGVDSSSAQTNPYSHVHQATTSSTGSRMILSVPGLISPIADVIPTIDGQFGDGEWDDANSVTATKIINMNPDQGKVYVKNTPDILYVLIDHYSPNAEGIVNDVTGDMWFDVNNNGIFDGSDGGFYTRACYGEIIIDHDFECTYGVANNPSPDNPNPHWIFEYSIPLEQFDLDDQNMGIHFVLFDYISEGGEWVNPTVDFDYGYPDRWADLHLSLPPTVSISTDSFEYSPGDTMTITLDIANPTEESVMFQWYWGVPQFSVWVPVVTAPIPAGYDATHDFSFTLPNWGPTPFGNVFYVQLLDAGGEVVDADCECWAYMQLRDAEGEVLDADCECWCKCWAYMQLRGAGGEVLDADCECWAYNPSDEAMPVVDIGEEIKKTIEKIDN